MSHMAHQHDKRCNRRAEVQSLVEGLMACGKDDVTSLNMDQRCDGWLSKTHPPKALLKRSGVTRQKGPLSRSIPPRAMLMNKSRLNLYTSYLTQNSPPPPQLMLATRQSTLGDYFGSKGDKTKTKVKVALRSAQETAPPSVCCGAEECQCEQSCPVRAVNEHQIHDETGQPVWMRAENEHQIHDETSQPVQTSAEIKQIYDETSQPVWMRAENKHQISDETSLTQNHYQNNTSDLLLSLHSSNILEDRHMNHNERDIVQCKQPLRTHKELDTSMPSCEKYFRNAGSICNKENCLHGCESECFFCRGSNKESTNCAGNEPKPGQGHVYQRSLNNNISIDETEEFITFSEGMKLLSQEPAVNGNCYHPLSQSQNQIWSEEDACSHSRHTASSAGLEGLSNSLSLDCVTQDTRSRCVEMPYAFPEVKVTLESFADDQNIPSPHAIRKQTRPSECVDKDTNVAKSEELARGLDSSQFTFTLPHTSDHEITGMRGSLQCRHLQKCKTPDFLETFFTISTTDTDIDAQSVSSQLSAFRGEQFEKRKAQYLLDLGTLALSENI